MAVGRALERDRPGDLLARAGPALPPPDRPRASAACSRLPRQSTSAPPTRSSGAAYSSTTGLRRQRPATTSVAGPRPVAPLLRARADDARVLDVRRRAAGPSRNSHLRRWLSTRLTCAPGQRNRERQARETRAAAEVGDPLGRAHDLELERHQRVRHVRLRRALRRANRRRRVLVALQQGQHRSATGAADGPSAHPFHVKHSRAGSPSVRERADHEVALGLVALAVGLDVAALAQVLVDDPPLERRQRVELDRLARPRAPRRQRRRPRPAAPPRGARDSRWRRSRPAPTTGRPGTRSAAPGAGRRRSSGRGGR